MNCVEIFHQINRIIETFKSKTVHKLNIPSNKCVPKLVKKNKRFIQYTCTNCILDSMWILFDSHKDTDTVNNQHSHT